MVLSSCMEDIIKPVDIKHHNSADLITYLETHGDYINSDDNTAIITVDDAYNSLSDYFLMDIRTLSQYQSGHIEGARNFGIEQLLDSLEYNSVPFDAKIIIISESGQKAAYATSLIRMYGFTNIFSLDFGMAQWNAQFADVMISARNDSEWSFLYEEEYYPKLTKQNILPNVKTDNESLTTEEFIKKRIKQFLTEVKYEEAIISVQEMDATYSLRYSKFIDGFIFCYDEQNLYEHKRYFKDLAPPVTWGGHPRTAAFYDAKIDFKASTNLLTLPVDKAIYNYTFNGQRSLFITAYLRLIGYNAKSVHYGAISMMYYKLLLSKFEESFHESEIRNYPIVN